MKAKEYFEKYEAGLVEDEKNNTIKTIHAMFVEMSDEVNDICNKRHTKSVKEAVAAVKEMNDRWNAVGSLFEKKYGHEFLKFNGFLEFWKKQIHEIADLV